MAPAKDEDSKQEDDSNDQDCLAKSRSRRQKSDKGGRLAALERLKKAKAAGEKNKYELSEEKSVYEVVDEDDYSDIVRQRQEDDWIVDDDGAGYAEDGREIFDDDLNDEIQPSKKRKDGEKKKNPNIVRPGTKPKRDIKSMFLSAPVAKKKPEKDVSLANDDLLGDLMEELHKGPQQNTMRPAPIKLTKKKPIGTTKSPYNPFASNSPNLKKPVPSQKTNLKPTVNGCTTSVKPINRVPLKTTIKQEPIETESPVIEEFHSMDTTEIEQVDSVPETPEDGGVDLQDIDFDEEVTEDKVTEEVEEKPSLPIKQESIEFSTSWDTFNNDNEPETISDIHVDTSQLPITTNEDGDQVLRFFWLDAYEDSYRQPGTVYLFGKVWIESAKAYVSCCLTVRNIERRIYLLPRATKFDLKTGSDLGDPVSLMDVYKEFNDKVAEKHKIMKFKSIKCTKQYAFEISDVPVESEYLEIRYSPELPQLPTDLKGQTFSHIFGAKTSSLENFLLDRKMKGPCWLDIKCPQIPNPPLSWCKVEAFVTRPDLVNVTKDSSLSIPPLVVMTLNLRTLPNPKTHQNEVIGASCLIQTFFSMDKPAPKQHFQQHFCAISKPDDCIFPFSFKEAVQKQKKMKVEILPGERALMGFLLAKIHKIDPDLIVGHDILSFDMDVLLHRINATKIPHWSKIGRLKRSIMPKLSGAPGFKGSFADRTAACGRLICDIKISARELIRSRSYDLTELTNLILKQKRLEVDTDDIKSMYDSSEHLLQFVELTLIDSTYILKIMYELNVIPLALQITNICGNVMSRTLLGGRSERNEYLLLHAFTERGFVVPDKEFKKKVTTEEVDDDEMDGNTNTKGKQGRRKPAYTGGLVLDPKRGFYDKFILLLDFNSLYPSIIQEYNICFTTINRTAPTKKEKQENEDDREDWLNLELPSPELEPGVLPTEIRKLVESRRQVKQLMKGQDVSHEQYMQYDIRQKALKLTANSMYGCLGFTYSRFYAKPLAALITGKGREILLQTKELVQNMNLEVIYGDTDSIMVNTNSTDMEQVFKLGNKIKAEVNKMYRLLEIDIDGVFKSMLLLKKKKYAALTVQKTNDGKYTTHQELKGLDIVRRDWCDLAKEAGNFVVSQILSGENREMIVENIHSKLIEVGEKVVAGELPVDLYHITKNLTKNPEDYPDKKSLPHVQVAIRLNSTGGKQIRAGDTVAYVICQDGSNLPASQRAYHPDELHKSETLKIDTKYYLANQVHPVVSRLCDPIEGTDAAHLAECLGLDPSGYRHTAHNRDEDEEAMLASAQMSEEEKYKDCQRFKFICSEETCGKEIILDSVFTGNDSLLECALASCTNPNCKYVPADHSDIIQNRLIVLIKQHIKKYYEGWLKCEDSACSTRTKKMPLTFQRGHPLCSACNRGLLHPEYTDSALYTQLCFYQFIFDFEKATTLLTEREKVKAKALGQSYRSVYDKLKRVAGTWLRRDAYSEVNLSSLFDGLFTLK